MSPHATSTEPTTARLATETIHTRYPPLDFATFTNIISYPLDHVPSLNSTTHSAPSPCTLEPGPPIPTATKIDVEFAIAAAGTAYEEWGRKPDYEERRVQVRQLLEGLEGEKEGLVRLGIREGGKPGFIANAEFDGTIQRSRALASLNLTDEIVEEDSTVQCIVRHYPLRVAVAIVPWNSPFHLLLVKLIPALLAGCPMIVKPSPHAPYQVLKVVELAQRYFPAGVVQGISGGEDVGGWLTGSKEVAKIGFTGSETVGRKIFEGGATDMKRLTLELGGNDAAIVCEDVDIPSVASKLAMNTFGNTGAMCVASKRIYVNSTIYAPFRAAFVSAVAAFKVGDPEKDPDVMIGPVQNKPQFEKVKCFLEDVKKHGWAVALQGGVKEGKGLFMTPTIVDNPPEDSKIVQEEQFGPIAPLLSWNSETDVIARANRTEVGLGASVWSRDKAQAQRIAERLEAGTVWINQGIDLRANVPFGGHKMSGIGSELGGLQAIKSYCNQQAVWMSKNV